MRKVSFSSSATYSALITMELFLGDIVVEESALNTGVLRKGSQASFTSFGRRWLAATREALNLLYCLPTQGMA